MATFRAVLPSKECASDPRSGPIVELLLVSAAKNVANGARDNGRMRTYARERRCGCYNSLARSPSRSGLLVIRRQYNSFCPAVITWAADRLIIFCELALDVRNRGDW